MKKRWLVIVGIAVVGAVVGVAASYIQGHNLAVLNPRGVVASRERDLIMVASLLMLVVVVPVFVLTFGIAWRYRAGNAKAKYTPDWDRSRLAESVWWGVPAVLILVLSGLTWVSSHQLDPYRPLASSEKPLTIQVVALDWKWLFIYPEQQIATVNMVEIPKGRPVAFEITSDAPMNSFWIPQLGGQIYAMPGMSTELHLMASGVGSYTGSSANLSGAGFAGMKFIATSVTPADFDAWVASVRSTGGPMDLAAYNALAKPTQNQPISSYAPVVDGLYNEIVMRYMMPNVTAGSGQ